MLVCYVLFRTDLFSIFSAGGVAENSIGIGERRGRRRVKQNFEADAGLKLHAVLFVGA